MFWSGLNHPIYDEEELSKMVFDSINYYNERAQRLAEENKILHDNAVKIVRQEFIEKIQSLKDRLALSYGEFSSQKELEAYMDFQERHMHDRATSRANGGKAPYLIPTGTGIGTNLKVVCPICGESEDITDDSVW